MSVPTLLLAWTLSLSGALAPAGPVAPTALRVPAGLGAPAGLVAPAGLGAPEPAGPAAATGGGQSQVDGVALLEDLAGEVRRVPLAELMLSDPRERGTHLIRLEAGPDQAWEPPAPAGEERDRALLGLGGGRDVLQGWLRGGEGDRLRLTLAGGSELEVLVEELATLVVPGRIPRDADASPEPAEEGDRLYLLRRGGLDRLDGLLHEFSDAGVSFESNVGLETYPWDSLVALFIEVFDEPPVVDEELGAAPVVVDLRGGSRLRGRLIELGPELLRLAIPAQAEVALPTRLVANLAVDDGSLVYLSELPPADLGPLSPTGDDLGMTWPPRFDRAVDGSPLRAGGRTWARGIGVHAPSRLTWSLGGGYRQLRTSVAIDEQAQGRQQGGSVLFRVLVDGELRYESPSVVVGGEAPVALPAIDLAGAEELVLEVDPGSDLWVRDRADWLAPLLVSAR